MEILLYLLGTRTLVHISLRSPKLNELANPCQPCALATRVRYKLYRLRTTAAPTLGLITLTVVGKDGVYDALARSVDTRYHDI